MDLKIFFVNGKDDDRWIRFKQSFGIMPPEVLDLLEKVNFAYSNDYETLAEEFNLSIKPQSLAFKLLFSQFPDLVGHYITHFAIYQKVVEDNLAGAFILESDICASDLTTFLSINPDFNENLDIVNMAHGDIEHNFHSYFVSNHGAKTILKLLANTYWLQNVERPLPSWFTEKENLQYNSEIFLKSDPTMWNQKNSISAPLSWIIQKAINLGLLQSEKFDFIHKINALKNEHEHNKSSYPDFWTMEEEELEDFIESSDFKFGRKKIKPKLNNLDYIYYINLDQDFEKAYNTDIQLATVRIPYERFPAVKPTLKDIQPDGQYYSFFKRNKFLEARSYFEEKFDWMDQEKYQLGTLGCYLSHYTLLQKIYKDNFDLDHVLIVEDDIKMNDSNIPLIENAISEAGKDWDIIRSTWSSTSHLSPINYCHPLSSYYKPEMIKRFLPRIMNIKYDCRACCPVMNTFYGGTHFQIIKVKSIPKILEYLDSDVLLPIDALYSTHIINVYQKKMDIDFGAFDGASGIQASK